MPPRARPDLTACDREPIRTPGAIQPHGVLVGVRGPGRTIAAASRNADVLLGRPAAEAIGQPLRVLSPPLDALLGAADEPSAGPLGIVGRIDGAGEGLVVMVHRAGDLVLVEIEPAPGAEAEARTAADRDAVLAGVVHDLQPPTPDADAYLSVARAVRRLTGFDRVLIYQFDEAFAGTVVAEDRNDVLPSYLGLRFPPTDIPSQARELYRINRVRQIPDASCVPVPIVSDGDAAAIDLSQSMLRAVSPVHLEYMRNMGTGASMSVSVLAEGRLWGLVSCHNAAPRRVPPAVRNTCDLLGRILSMRIAAQAIHADAADRVGLQAAQARLLAAMAEGATWYEGLAAAEGPLLDATRSAGAAIVRDDGCILFGDTPDEETIRRIAAWLDTGGRDLVATATLAADMEVAGGTVGAAAGLLAVSLSRMHADWLIWFRPELVRTVTWGGDPRKSAEGPDVRISPRKSFEAWRETVRGTSAPWTAAEVDAARAMRTAIVDIVLRKAEELAALSEDLRRSNKELEAFSYSISHDLRAPFRHIVGYAELLAERERGRMDEKSAHYLRNISDAAETAGRLVDDLLHFAQMGRVKIVPVRVDVNKLVTEVCRSLALEIRDRRVEWRANDMPVAQGDPSLLRQVLYNLVANAVKYSRGRDPAVIEIGGWSGDTETTYYVRDNGIGFDMAYAEKLFQVFQRLNRTEEFEGTGIGLALVRRIVERHGGRTWAAGQLGRGATFYFALPAPKEGAP